MDETYAPEIVMDRESSTPLYEQIARPIEAAILSGELPAGALIEDEVSMAQRLDVARPTARPTRRASRMCCGRATPVLLRCRKLADHCSNRRCRTNHRL